MSFVEPVGFKISSRVKASLDKVNECPFHMHDEVLEIICVVKGNFNISESAQDYVLTPGDVYIFNPKDPHKLTSSSPDPILITIQIDQEHYAKLFNIDGFPYFICDSFFQDTEDFFDIRHLRFLIGRILVEYLSEEPSSTTTEELTKELLQYLINNHKNYFFVKTSTSKIKMMRKPYINDNDKQQQRIYRIIDYIYANFNRKITLEEIADMEYLSLGYLSRYIKETSGLTFSEHVSLARCEEVERLLGNTDKTIDQMAIDVGFANRNHLAAQFKKWFSKTPTEYKQSINSDIRRISKANYEQIDYDEVKDVINKFLDER